MSLCFIISLASVPFHKWKLKCNLLPPPLPHDSQLIKCLFSLVYSIATQQLLQIDGGYKHPITILWADCSLFHFKNENN